MSCSVQFSPVPSCRYSMMQVLRDDRHSLTLIHDITRTPRLCQRRFQQRNREQAEERAAEMIRESLRNLNLLRGRLEGHRDESSRNANVTDDTGGYLNQENRREFIKNVLVSRVSAVS